MISGLINMVQLCSVKGCKNKGHRRVKSILKECPAAASLYFTERHEILRICKVHYQSVLKTSAVESGLDDSQNDSVVVESGLDDIQNDSVLVKSGLDDSQNDSVLDESLYEDVEYLEDEYMDRIEDSNEISFSDNLSVTDNVCDNLTDGAESSNTFRPAHFYLYKVFLQLVFCLLFVATILTAYVICPNVVKIKIEKLSKRIKDLHTENFQLRNSLKNASTKLDTISTHLKNLEESLSLIFNFDQLNILKKKLKRPKKWSDITIVKALKTKFACCKRGYKSLLNDGYPFPSFTILRRRLQGINFQPGILEDVFTFLKVKVKSFTESEKECFLVIDEMSIVEGNQIENLNRCLRPSTQR